MKILLDYSLTDMLAAGVVEGPDCYEATEEQWASLTHEERAVLTGEERDLSDRIRQGTLRGDGRVHEDRVHRVFVSRPAEVTWPNIVRSIRARVELLRQAAIDREKGAQARKARARNARALTGQGRKN